MKRILWPLLALVLILSSCGTPSAPTTFTLLDGEQVIPLQSEERIPAKLAAEAGLTLSPADRVLYLGLPVPQDQPLPTANSYTLQIRHAVPVTLVTPDGQQIIQSAAFTVGEALAETGLQLYAADQLTPPAETPISGPLTVSYVPSRQLVVQVDGKSLPIRSAAATVGEALAGAGIPLEGLDTSLPAESEALPADGQVRVVRIRETVQLQQKPIPFESRTEQSAEIDLGQQQVLQAGEYGLQVSRVRVRYEDGQEVSRQTESESVVRPPKDKVVAYGTKISLKTLKVPGGQIEYWYAASMFATSYSPCRSGADRCYSGTASGKPVKKGVVAVTYDMYLALQGQAVYIPGYGTATIEDVGGGIPGTPWIDLGYSDADWVEWGDWVTVYFLAPAPANAISVLP
jgi:uncharacterized protein YabE (DUF348 family)